MNSPASKLTLYLFFIFTLFVSSISFSTPFSLPMSDDVVNLKSYTQMYTGSDYSTLDGLISSDVVFSDFTSKPNLPGNAEHWIKIELMNTSDFKKIWYLHIGYPSMPLMHAYWSKGGGIEVISLLDSHSSYSDRLVDEPQLFLPLSFIGGEEKTLYINYRILGDSPISLRLFTERGFKKYQFKESSINSAVFGFMVAIFFFVITFLVMSRDILYLYFGCLVLAMSLAIGDLAGYNHKYLWPQSGVLAESLVEFIFVFIHLSYLFFIREVMQFKALNKTLYNVFSGLIYFSFAILFALSFIHMFDFFMVFGFLLMPIYIYCSVWGMKANLVSSKIIALSIYSHILFLFLLFTLSILIENPFPSVYFMKYVTIGYVLEVMFFSMTLAHRSYITNKRYQQSLLKRVEEAKVLIKIEQKNNLLLKEKQEQLLKFTGTVHDIFQPLSSVRMAVGVISDESGKDIKNYIDNTVGYAESLLKSFMLDSKNSFQNSSSHLVLGEMFENVVLRHQSSANEKGIQLQFFNSIKVCDTHQENLIRVLDNLTSNAIRYTKSGGVLIGARHKSMGVEIQVVDTGIGMSLVETKKLLEPFEQSEVGKQGYGIGLYVVKKLCEQSGFELSVSSELKKGTSFKVLIPN